MLNKIEYYRSWFFWQYDQQKKKKYRLAKSIICQLKEKGGLGIQNLDIQHKYLLSKWLFKLYNEDGLWQQLLMNKCAKYKTLWHVKKIQSFSFFDEFNEGERSIFKTRQV